MSIDMQKVEEAVKLCKECSSPLTPQWELILDLAESVLAVGKEMPAKDSEKEIAKVPRDLVLMATARNKTIDECALITTRLLAEKDKEIESLAEIVGMTPEEFSQMRAHYVWLDDENERLEKELEEKREAIIWLERSKAFLKFSNNQKDKEMEELKKELEALRPGMSIEQAKVINGDALSIKQQERDEKLVKEMKDVKD